MPQIQEYLPEVGAQGPVGGVSPNVELSGASGRGIEQIGQAIGEGADLLHRRAAQEETANIYSAFAEKRAQYINQIQQQTQDGSLDTDKIKEQYENDVEQLGQNIDTPEGKNFFERQQARLKATVLQSAARSQATLAKNRAVESWKNGMGQTSSAIMKDPVSFKDSYDAGLETIDQMVKNGGLPEKFRDEAARQMGVEYSKAAIRGVADTDPAAAKNLVDGGEFDQHLNSDQKHEMLGEISHYASAQETEKKRTQKAIDDAKSEQTDKWFNDNYAKIETGGLSTKDVINNQNLDWEDKQRAIHLIEEASKRELKSDSRVKQVLLDRIVNPNSTNPITDDSEIDQHVGKGISISDANQMRTLLHKSPEQQAQATGEKSLFKSIDSTIRFKNMMTNQYDLLGEQNAARAKFDYIQAKKDIKAQGGSPADLVNPNSPLYFGNKLQSYQTSLQEQLSHQSQDRKDKALNLKSDEHQTSPGTPPKEARRKNESPAEYLKRTGLGG